MTTATPVDTDSTPPELAAARGIADELAVGNARRDRDGNFPFDNIELLKSAGLHRMTLAPEFGGLGTPLPVLADVMRTIAAADPSTALIIVQHLGSVGNYSHQALHAGNERLFRFCDSELRAGKLQALFAGAPEFEGREPARVIRVDNGFVLRGRKGFGTGADAVDWGTGPFEWHRDDGERWLAVVLYRMDDPALARAETWDTLGMRSTNSHDLEFRDLFVPDEHVVFLTPEAQFPRETFGQNYFRFGLITFGALYLGIAEAAWSYLRRVLRDRSVPGGLQPIIEIPGLYNAVGAIDMRLREATAMLHWTVHEHADPLRWDATTLPAIAAMKDAVTRDAVWIVEACMQALGGAAYYRRVPLERLYRDVRAGPIHPFNHPAAMALLGRMLAS